MLRPEGRKNKEKTLKNPKKPVYYIRDVFRGSKLPLFNPLNRGLSLNLASGKENSISLSHTNTERGPSRKTLNLSLDQEKSVDWTKISSHTTKGTYSLLQNFRPKRKRPNVLDNSILNSKLKKLTVPINSRFI